MLQVGYIGTDSTARGPSTSIWGQILVNLLLRGEGGHGIFSDFDASLNGYDVLAGTGCTTAIGAAQYGVLEQTHDGTANDECSIQTDGSSFFVDTSPNQRLAFEARIKKSEIGTNVTGLFLGLADAGQAATSTLVNTTGALETGTTNFIGFHVPMGTSGATCNFVYKASGQTAATLIAGVHTFVADTYVKLGFHFDPTEANPAKRLKVYVNGAEQSTYGTDTQLAAATFPDNVPLGPILHSKAGSSAASAVVSMDWWQCVAEDRG